MLNKINTFGAWTLTLGLAYSEVAGIYPNRWFFILLPVLVLNVWALLTSFGSAARRLKHG